VSETPAETPGVFTRTAALYDAVYSFKDYAGEASRLHDLIERRRRGGGDPPPPPGAPPSPQPTLLDVACGTGKHLEHLRRWYAVEGVDLDPRLLDLAARRLPGVPLHQGDMTDFDLGRTFQAVLSLFSSIGYVKTLEGLRRAVACLARHVAPGGVLVVEPWFTPDVYNVGRPHALLVDQPDLKLARLNVSAVAGSVSILAFHYLLATPAGVEYFTEHHELGLFTQEDYAGAFRDAGLVVEHDPQGLTGRGLYVGTWPGGAPGGGRET
jgi:SAM-dependent methyltransferase